MAKNDNGKFKRKKRFGKSLANKAPSMLLAIIDRKLGYYGEKLIEINTFESKASQFNQIEGTHTKKSLSQRWNDFNGINIQRDMYSAFLIMNISDDCFGRRRRLPDGMLPKYSITTQETKDFVSTKHLPCLIF